MNEEEKKKLMWIEAEMKWYSETIGEPIHERRNEYQRAFNKTGKGKAIARKYQVKYSKTEKGRRANRKGAAKYQRTDRGKVAHRTFLQTEKGKVITKKHGAKRRSLGFVELNEPFHGSEGHHITKMFVIYLPKEMHQSIWHNVFTGKNMDEINDLAIDYCYGD